MNSGANVDAELAVPVHRTTRRALLLAAFGWILASRPGAAQDRAPWFGTWEQELAPPASRLETPPYKKVTTRIEPWRERVGRADGEGVTGEVGDAASGASADMVRVTYDMVRARGGITHVEWVGRFDGRDYPVQGVDSFLTNAYRILDDRRYEIVIKVDTTAVATATAAVSADGQTLTVTTVERDARGRQRTSTAVYRRQHAVGR
jgi:hypothetical protein